MNQLNLSLVKTSQDTQTVERLLLETIYPTGKDNVPLQIVKAATVEIRQWVEQKKCLKGAPGRTIAKLQNLVAGLEHIRRTKGYDDETKMEVARLYYQSQLTGNGHKDGLFRPGLYSPQTAAV